MEYPELREELRKTIQPLLEEDGFELVELNFSQTRSSSNISILAERAEGRITIAECARLNRKIAGVLDTGSVIQENYTLEVSSPGIDRPLRTKNDFFRCQGKDVKFFLMGAINGKIEWDGKVLGVDEVKVTIETAKGNLDIPLVNIVKAKQIF